MFQRMLEEYIGDDFFVYHLVTEKTGTENFLKKYGLCSPKALYNKNYKLFMKTSFEIYKRRTAIFLNKDEKDLKGKDIIDYLDNAKQRQEFDSSTLFFTFIPIERHHRLIQKEMSPSYQLKINYKVLSKKTPLIVGPGKNSRETTWDKIKTPEFIEFVEKQSKKSPENLWLIFKHVPHLAVPGIYNIPYESIAEIKRFDYRTL